MHSRAAERAIMKQPQWSLVQYTLPGDARVRVGIDSNGVIRRAPAELPDLGIVALLDNWAEWAPVLRAMDVTVLEVVAEASLVAPLTHPRKLICAGANYYDHAEEMGTARPDPLAAPFFFLKPPTTAIIGPDDSVVLPATVDAKVDYEAELGVVIADRCKSITAADAREHIAGYVVANDVSARGMFNRPTAVEAPFSWDWFSHKGQDGFSPIGPGFVPAWLVQDPQDLDIALSVNGVTKQQSNTREMVVSINELVAAASRLVTLEPGDVILTGTPAGVGMPRGDFLSAGDVVVTEIDGLGRLVTTIVAAAEEPALAQ
jgi:2-keto-4-pentenoate hydratase/2-oxohepta-3-ene-1,7-dioic acid hydratase in catechol pathway